MAAWSGVFNEVMWSTLLFSLSVSDSGQKFFVRRAADALHPAHDLLGVVQPVSITYIGFGISIASGFSARSLRIPLRDFLSPFVFSCAPARFPSPQSSLQADVASVVASGGRRLGRRFRRTSPRASLQARLRRDDDRRLTRHLLAIRLAAAARRCVLPRKNDGAALGPLRAACARTLALGLATTAVP